MADAKITGLTALTTLATADLLAIVDDPSGTPITKKVTVANLLGAIAGTVVFNEAGGDYDFRIEGDAEANLFYLDAGNDRVGIGTASPEKQLHLWGADVNTVVYLLKLSHGDAASGAGAGILFAGNAVDAGRGKGALVYEETALGYDRGSFHFLQETTGDTSNPTISDSVMTIENSGDVGIGVTAPVAKLHVDQASTTGAIPVLTLDQADIDIEFIKLIGSSEDSTADRSLVDVADMTTPGALVGWFQIYVEDIQGTNPITDGVYYVPFYAAPSA